MQQHVAGCVVDHSSIACLVAELVEDSCMFDEDHLEGWCVARHLMSEDLEVPLAEKLLQLLLEIGSEGPWRSKCRCLRGRFTFPPFDGCINCIQ